ncbi:hypothetical protein NPIL_417231 [Nephila pilipes]|uniref:Uncharacterized protein n=1 Tax=Nephila pilipes TaxID=299642 RepID=A0A8X6IMD1_NEPPI|nr:hypothetical protein NPIL_417231 [Nephila pilipes]
MLNIPFDGAKQEVACRILCLLCDLEVLAENSAETLTDSDTEDQDLPHNSGEKKIKSDSSIQCESRDDLSRQCNINNVCDSDYRKNINIVLLFITLVLIMLIS